MKHRGDNAPPSFSVEEQPNKPGFVLARFYENVEPFSETVEETTISGYQYDEYYLELADYDGLESDIQTNLPSYLIQARAQAEQDAFPSETIARQQKIIDEQQAIINVLMGGES